MSRQLILIWGITILVATGLGFFALWPGIEHDLEAMRQTEKAQNDLADYGQKKVVLAKLSKDQSLSDLAAQAKQYVPEDAQAGELILMLTNLAGQANLTVDQATFDQKNGNNQFAIAGATSTGFHLKLSGDFMDALKFLGLIETSDRLVILQNLKLSQASDSFSMDINGTAYSKQGFQNDFTLANITIKPETVQKIKSLGLTQDLSSGLNITNPFSNTR